MKKIVNLMLMTMYEYQNIKTFSQKAAPQVEEVYVIKKLKNTEPWTYYK